MKNTATPRKTETPEPLTQREEELVNTIRYLAGSNAELRTDLRLKNEQVQDLEEQKVLKVLVGNLM